MDTTKTNEELYFEQEYMPYMIKWGKITSWLSILLIFIPALALMVFEGARPSAEGIITGLLSLISAMSAWYIVDPITLYPILHVPGMYMTYIAGNSKEIRGPSATAALNATKVQAGTKEGTVISTIAISVSIFISIAVMTIVAIAGQLILDILPESIILALNYLLPALFGAMFMERVMADYKVAAIAIPSVLVLRLMNIKGLFSWLPLGGSYAQILLAVVAGVFISKKVHAHVIKSASN